VTRKRRKRAYEGLQSNELRNELQSQVAELNTLRSLPLNIAPTQQKTVSKSGTGEVHGLVMKLVQKEKQVVQLQAEVERLKVQNPTAKNHEAEERARRERDRLKWNKLNEEVADLKTKVAMLRQWETELTFLQNTELEVALASKVKETLYLKRALESVYSRFSSNVQARAIEPQGKESEIDAELIANRTIDSLVKKDEEITSLKAQITGLTEQMENLKVSTSAAPTPASEKEFKSMVAPPPPPPPAPKPKPKRQLTVVSVVPKQMDWKLRLPLYLLLHRLHRLHRPHRCHLCYY
jgi:diaphanous 1